MHDRCDDSGNIYKLMRLTRDWATFSKAGHQKMQKQTIKIECFQMQSCLHDKQQNSNEKKH